MVFDIITKEYPTLWDTLLLILFLVYFVSSICYIVSLLHKFIRTKFVPFSLLTTLTMGSIFTLVVAYCFLKPGVIDLNIIYNHWRFWLTITIGVVMIQWVSFQKELDKEY